MQAIHDGNLKMDITAKRKLANPKNAGHFSLCFVMISRCNTNHSSWRNKTKENTLYMIINFILSPSFVLTTLCYYWLTISILSYWNLFLSFRFVSIDCTTYFTVHVVCFSSNTSKFRSLLFDKRIMMRTRGKEREMCATSCRAGANETNALYIFLLHPPPPSLVADLV